MTCFPDGTLHRSSPYEGTLEDFHPSRRRAPYIPAASRSASIAARHRAAASEKRDHLERPDLDSRVKAKGAPPCTVRSAIKTNAGEFVSHKLTKRQCH